MVRRLLRILCVVGLAVLVGMALVGQFWHFGMIAGYARIDVNQPGVWLTYREWSEWGVVCSPGSEWFVSNLLRLPNWHEELKTLRTTHHYATLGLPWWLLLSTLGLFTALIWRLTRPRKVEQGFPIEPTAQPK